MIIRPIARNTTAPTYTCASENPYCLSTQRESNNNNNNNNTSSPATGTTNPTPLLTHRNLVGVLIIAALLALGLILWLCFGKWSKPIRHFLRGESRHNDNYTVRGDGLAPGPIDRSNGATNSTTVSKAPGPRGNDDTAAAAAANLDDAEKPGIVDSSSSQSSLDREEMIETDKDKEVTRAKLEPKPALPAKVR
jgi:hypothetical protein